MFTIVVAGVIPCVASLWFNELSLRACMAFVKLNLLEEAPDALLKELGFLGKYL